MNRIARRVARWFGKRKDALPLVEPTRRPVDVARRRSEALRRRQEAFGSPPLSEWEVDMRYGAVEAEREQQG